MRHIPADKVYLVKDIEVEAFPSDTEVIEVPKRMEFGVRKNPPSIDINHFQTEKCEVKKVSYVEPDPDGNIEKEYRYALTEKAEEKLGWFIKINYDIQKRINFYRDQLNRYQKALNESKEAEQQTRIESETAKALKKKVKEANFWERLRYLFTGNFGEVK